MLSNAILVLVISVVATVLAMLFAWSGMSRFHDSYGIPFRFFVGQILGLVSGIGILVGLIMLGIALFHMYA